MKLSLVFKSDWINIYVYGIEYTCIGRYQAAIFKNANVIKFPIVQIWDKVRLVHSDIYNACKEKNVAKLSSFKIEILVRPYCSLNKKIISE